MRFPSDPTGRLINLALALIPDPAAASAACTMAAAVLATVGQIPPHRVHAALASAFVELADRMVP